jgi:hypothetical protein
MPNPNPNSFQDAVEKRMAQPPAVEKRYGFEVDPPDLRKNLTPYFEKNKHVAGIVWGGGYNGSNPDDPIAIVSNPFNEHMADEGKKEGLYKLEAARAIMDKNPVSEYPISENLQRLRKQHFKPHEPYYSNDQAFRESLVSRVLVGDLPKKLITPEIQAEADRFEKLLKQRE